MVQTTCTASSFSTTARLSTRRSASARLKMMGGLVSNTRFLELEKLDTASTIFSNGELIGGLLGPTVARRMGRKIYRGFQAMSEALKARAEAQWRAEGGAPTSTP